ncbi:MAG: cytochrome c oxidase assembly protein [Pseudomonadota bacterium]
MTARQQTEQRGKNLRTVGGSLAILVTMSVLVVYAVPLYQYFCRVTGYGGTTQKAASAPATVGMRVITIRFNSDVSPGLPWAFQPVRRQIKVRVGERKLAVYTARNRSGDAVTGTATFNVTPQKAGQYFNKIACFCFEEQRLNPGQAVDMPVSFFVDPTIVKDRNMDDVNTITLSYTFFRAVSERDKRTDTMKRAAAAQRK